MICNRCVKQDVCKIKADTEAIEKSLALYDSDSRYHHLEMDCKHREPATDAQMSKIKERTDY
jgi:hypothetical protein